MRFKVGDKVRIKSLDWYNKNKTEEGCLVCGSSHINPEMICMLGKTVTISSVEGDHYRIKEYAWNWTDEMIEGLVEEEIIDIDDFQDDNEIIDIIDEYVHRLKNNECQINLPEGYQFTDENGNIINATKIVLEKKKKEYPKTYEECAEIIAELTGSDCNPKGCMGYMSAQLTALQKLLICRDAYWKIAGEEMGLGKPWEPDWGKGACYTICCNTNRIVIGIDKFRNSILAFPTEEMRDAFYENFKSEIEECKELL